jgi:ATP-dependent Clp protease protease subunit
MAGRTTGLLVAAGRERRVPLRGWITPQNAAACIARLVVLAVEGPGQPIVIYIDSQGGSVTESLSIISTMNGIRCPVATFCHGTAAGTAAVIAAHGMHGYRTAVDTSAYSFKAAQTDAQNRDTADARHFYQILAEITAKDSRKPVPTVMNWLARGTQFDAQHALASGLIDVIAVKPVLPPG